MPDEYLFIPGDSFTVDRETERAVKLSFGNGRNDVWFPRSVLRITVGKADWEVKRWWVEKTNLWDFVDESEEAHA